jgi:Tol biopolymer transport system component
MSPEQWNKIVELFHAAREKTPTERAALLDSACAADPELRQVVEQMLRDDGASCSLLDRSPIEVIAADTADPRTLASAGVRFGRYEIVTLIGRGGTGEVWAAHDTELNRAVAIKFLFPRPGFGPLAERLTHEARAASALNHPNIVTVYEVTRHEDTPVIVMEMVKGEPLGSARGTPQPLEQVVQLTLQAAKALAAAHAHGIIHCDVKPENILVRSDGYVKVLDFGLARQIGRDATAAGIVGTPRYMSPEQARAEVISPATDIYSLGLVLYELVTGQHAFPGHSPFLQAVPNSRPVVPSSINPRVPANLDSLILAMLASKPEGRPSAAEVSERLGEALAKSQQLRHRRIWQAALVGAVVLAFVLWMASSTLFNWRDKPQFANLRIQPLTSQAGWEGTPALSPDGRTVAFTWTDRLGHQRQIYRKGPNDTEPVKLTNYESEGNIGYLAWSPDGSRIAFKRQRGMSGAIYSIASTGGDERKIVDLEIAYLSSSIDWSPDGEELAFSDASSVPNQLSIYIYNLRSSLRRKLTDPPALADGDWSPKFSPDGLKVAFKRVIGYWADEIYLVPAAGGTPRRLTDARGGIWGHAWTADGKSLIVSWQRSSTIFGIWRVPLSAPSQAESITQGGIDAITPATSLKASRMAWVNQLWDLNIYRIPANGVGKPEELIASTLRDQGATYSPDGSIAFISDRSGSKEIWLAKGDGSQQVQVTHFSGPSIDHLQWSPDGRMLAFDARPHGYSDIFTLECDSAKMGCGQPKPLSMAPAVIPSWSADGEFIYFASNRTGRWEIWRVDLSGGRPLQLTNNGGYMSRESRDGKWLYFSKYMRDSIWRTPGSQAQNRSAFGEAEVIGPPYKVKTDDWTLTADEIVFLEPATSTKLAAIRAYRIATGRTRSILELPELLPDTRGNMGVSVSPDSGWVLYSQLDRSASNVMVADHIR